MSINIFVMLKFPPLKQPKFTNYFVYQTKNKNTQNLAYKMFNREGKYVGYMEGYSDVLDNERKIYADDGEFIPSFYVKKLFSYDRGKGVGSAFMKIAQKESQRNMCLGNVHLTASSYYDKERPPHIFYRKIGFDFTKLAGITAQKIDDCIKKNLPMKDNVRVYDMTMFKIKDVDKDGKNVDKFYDFKVKFPELFEYL